MIQEDMTVDDALKLMEEGQRLPNRPAPMLPPKVLGRCNDIYTCIHIMIYSHVHVFEMFM